MNANEEHPMNATTATGTRRVNFYDGDSAQYDGACQADFDAGRAAFDPHALSAANFMPAAIYLDNARRQAFFCGWRFADEREMAAWIAARRLRR